MGTFKGLQILLAINQQTKTSYLPARVRAFGLPPDAFREGFPALFAFGFPDLLAKDEFSARFGFVLDFPLLRFS